MYTEQLSFPLPLFLSLSHTQLRPEMEKPQLPPEQKTVTAFHVY